MRIPPTPVNIVQKIKRGMPVERRDVCGRQIPNHRKPATFCTQCFLRECYVAVGLAICKPCGILGDRVKGTLARGEKRQESSGNESEPGIRRREILGSKISTPRGEGGEGRVRIWRYIPCFRFSFVHVFNGYVASLSIIF